MSILTSLEKKNIVSFTICGTACEVTERCDGYHSTMLSIGQLDELLMELAELRSHLFTNKQRDGHLARLESDNAVMRDTIIRLKKEAAE
jgi:hypothetical protein